MGSCTSHSIIEVKIRSVLVCVKVPQLKSIQKSSICKRRREFKKNKRSECSKGKNVEHVGKVEKRFALVERNW
jgi:hypothetical protein